jgi:integrase
MKGCRPFTDDEIDSIAAALAHPRDRALFLVGIHTGFRISELLAIRLGDVVRNGRVVDVVAVAKRNTKGKRSGRSVPLHRRAKAAIEEWVDAIDPNGKRPADTFLFKSRQGGNRPITRQQFRAVLDAAYQQVGIVTAPGVLATHAMRKSFAARVYERSEKNLLLTQKALGHASVASTASYLATAELEVTDVILSD